MDFLKKQAASFTENQQHGDAAGNQQGSTSTDQNLNTNTNTTTTGGQTTNTGGEDYGDKGLDFLEKKTGHTFGREQNEKITDGARGLFEKASGSKIDSKYSN